MKLKESEYKGLVKEAKSARVSAYIPYSHFAVGAAVLCEDGRIFRGFNIENASYPATMCAERTALYSAITAGARKFVAIAVVGGKEGEEPCGECTPCGVCLQVISELCGADAEIVTEDNDGEIKVRTLSDFLPHRFTDADLSGNTRK